MTGAKSVRAAMDGGRDWIRPRAGRYLRRLASHASCAADDDVSSATSSSSTMVTGGLTRGLRRGDNVDRVGRQALERRSALLAGVAEVKARVPTYVCAGYVGDTTRTAGDTDHVSAG